MVQLVGHARLSGGGIGEPLGTLGADRLWLLEADIERRHSLTSLLATAD